jgi:serine/threonine protein kinase/Tfp pilus assembly protein PilF
MAASPHPSEALTPGPWQPPAREVQSLIECLAAEMAERWRNGERPLAEEFFAREPEVGDQPETALELIAEELALREETGIGIHLIELQGRFPQWRREVEILARCNRMMAVVRLPVVGETLGEFRLLAELGRGAESQVYLATQPSLAGRPVVLKLSPNRSGEHLLLARLQHTHIVPLFSVHEFPAQGLSGICQPYLGGTTLATLLNGLSDRTQTQRSGNDLLDAIQQSQAGRAEIPTGGPACRFLAEASYVEAVCWMGMCLAEALQHAHERDLVHLDVKPSNILLAADGQPMLLDFHLAREPLPANGPTPALLGGTPRYMAPEHRAALEAVREQHPVPHRVDGRADIYSLALVMYEALGGTLPASGDTALTLRAHNPQVTTSLVDLLTKCLAPEASLRYRTAGNLAADLRRYLADLPLRGASNGGLPERWQRWRRRRPYVMPVLCLMLAIVGGAIILFGRTQRQLERAEAAWQQGEQYLFNGRSTEALESFQHGAALVEGLPVDRGLRHRLQDGSRRAERVEAVKQLHVSCEQMRAIYGNDPSNTEPARLVESMCARLWQNRDRIVEGLDRLPTTELQEQVRVDLLDVAILWVDLHVRLADMGQNGRAREEALAVLAEAEGLFGPNCVLRAERREHRRALGLPDAGEEPNLAPRNAWEHYALGRLYLRTGEITRAAAEMDRALALQPQALWANFYKARCAFQAGAYEDAVVAFSVCVALAPTSAWTNYHRGLAYLELDRPERAKCDFDAALRLDPSLTAAFLGRGVAHFRLNHHANALADLRHVIEREPSNKQARALLAHLESQP